jgi:hypothetical protein
MSENQRPKKSSFGLFKVAAGGSLTLIVGLLIAFLDHGGIDLIKSFTTNQKDQSSQSSTTPLPSTPENSRSPSTQIAQTPVSGDNSSIASAASPSSSVTQSSAASKSNLPSSQTFEKSGFLFESKGCIREVAEVQCNFLITSNNGDKPLILRGNAQDEDRLYNDPIAMAFQGTTRGVSYTVDVGSSRLIALDGTPYLAQDISSGSVKSEKFIQITFPNKIPITAKLTFLGVPQQEAHLALAELSVQSMLSKISSPNQTSFAVQFRNVPILGSK